MKTKSDFKYCCVHCGESAKELYRDYFGNRDNNNNNNNNNNNKDDNNNQNITNTTNSSPPPIAPNPNPSPNPNTNPKPNKQHIRLCICSNSKCKKVVDPYIEYEYILVIIDLFLHKPRAYRHVLFNSLPSDTAFRLRYFWKLTLTTLTCDSYMKSAWNVDGYKNLSLPTLELFSLYLWMILASLFEYAVLLLVLFIIVELYVYALDIKFITNNSNADSSNDNKQLEKKNHYDM